MATPQTQYARTADGLSIAYQTLGEGPPDLVFVRAWHTNVEHDWDERVLAHVFRRLSTFGRLILFDRRGTGLSDPAGSEAANLDARMDDVTAVLDAVGCGRATLIGLSDFGTPLCALYAASHPDRVDRLVLYNPHVREIRTEDYPWADSEQDLIEQTEQLIASWGDLDAAAKALQYIAPSRADDPALAEWLATSQRRSASPRAARLLAEVSARTDVRDVLPAIRCPTLVVHRGAPTTPLEEAEWITSRIASARLVSFASPDHMLISGDTDAVVDEIERFITGDLRTAPVFDRVLASLLFTDIVSSTEELARIGDHGWRQLIEQHHAVVRQLLATYRGVELDTAGDGFFASFDGPARAVRCAQDIVSAVRQLGLRVRAGVHTGECEVAGDKLSGLAVVVAARVMAIADPETTLVTSTVRDLTAGSGIDYADAGRHVLKGVPDEWQLFRVRSQT